MVNDTNIYFLSLFPGLFPSYQVYATREGQRYGLLLVGCARVGKYPEVKRK